MDKLSLGNIEFHMIWRPLFGLKAVNDTHFLRNIYGFDCQEYIIMLDLTLTVAPYSFWVTQLIS